MSSLASVLDPTQLVRIQATHRGFLYQHLFAVGTLLLAGVSSLEALHVERDEDIEILLPRRRIYTQVKTRSQDLQPSDVTEMLQRFDEIREAHKDGRRPLVAEFWIVTNAEPSSSLKKAMNSWSKDVHFRSPNFNLGKATALPPAWKDVAEGTEWCIRQAEKVPFASLGPETLVWKLAGLILYSCTGGARKELTVAELPSLLEQLVVQLHRFPALPAKYRPHEKEPDFNSNERTQLVIGFSGSGKTTWAAQGSLHSGEPVTYFDVGDAPTAAVAPSLARELAATVLPGKPEEIKRMMLPGASALQSLRALELYIRRNGFNLTIVMDNVHRMNGQDLIQIIRAVPSPRWIILAQPWPERSALEAAFQIDAQSFHGWSLRDIAEEFSNHGCQLSPLQAERVRRLTGGLPLFVQSSAKMARDYYGANAERFCEDIENLTHSRMTGQEAILRQVQQKLPAVASQVASLFSISDIALPNTDARFFIQGALGLSDVEISAAMRELEAWGIVETLRNGRLSMHDAFRPLAKQNQSALGSAVVAEAKKLLVSKLMTRHGVTTFRLLCRLLPDIGQMETLVDIASDSAEYFHEFGMSQEFENVLLEAVQSKELRPGDKFWALDTIVFWKLQANKDEEAEQYLQQLTTLSVTFEPTERQAEAIALKRLVLAGHRRDRKSMQRVFKDATALSPKDQVFHRILRYNYAACLYSMKLFDAAARITFPLIREYFDVLGLELEDVTFKNPPEIIPKINQAAFEKGEVKRLADSLDLHARVMEAQGISSPFGRIHAFKFYAIANAVTSAVKAGQEVVDHLLRMGDADGARHFMESALLPVFSGGRALDYFVPVHSQYAVLLAYCGETDAARRTMSELIPFLQASPEWQAEYENQQELIESIAEGIVSLPPTMKDRFGMPEERPRFAKAPRSKIGRNQPCPCGSGKKFKKCCGTEI